MRCFNNIPQNYFIPRILKPKECLTTLSVEYLTLSIQLILGGTKQVPGLRNADISAHLKRAQEAAKSNSNSRVSLTPNFFFL